jgi:hypothetical protein
MAYLESNDKGPKMEKYPDRGWHYNGAIRQAGKKKAYY